MRRTTVLLAALVLLTPVAAGADYFAELATRENSTDIRVDGDWYWSAEEDGTRITVTYDTVLINDAYNETTLDAFELYVRDADGIIATTALNTGTVNDLAGVSGITRIIVPAPATDITRFGFTANHTALLATGGTVDREVDGWVPVDIEVPPVTLSGFRTNATTVVRGQDIWVNGTAENADTLHYGNRTLDVLIDGRFSGRLPVPVDIGTGEQRLTYRFTTDRGSRVNASLPVTVENVAPTLTVQQPSEVQRGAGFRLRYTAVDETPGLSVNATFADRTASGSGGTVTFDQVAVDPGNYTVTVTATDRDGAVATANVTVAVVPRPTPDQPEDDGGAPLPEEDPIGFAKMFLEFVVGFFTFLIPGI